MIVKNSARCDNCQQEIESKHRHDFVTCQCGNLSVDGGKDYLKRCYQGSYTETSLIKEEDAQALQVAGMVPTKPSTHL